MSVRRARTTAAWTLFLAGGWIVLGEQSTSADPAPSASSSPAPHSAPPPQTSEDVSAAVAALQAAIEGLGGKLGASVLRLEDGTELANANGLTAMNPASNAKIPTAIAALTVLGSERRFSTALFGDVENGKVGRLVLRGRGDPAFSTADLRDLVRQLRAAGVDEVERVVVDQSHFEGSWVPPAFDQQPEEWAPFRAPTAAVSLERNVVSLAVRAGAAAGDAARVVGDPPLALEIEASVKTGKKGSAERVSADLSPKGDHLSARVSGSVPVGSKPVWIARRLDDPRAVPGYALRAILIEQGIKVSSNEIAVAASPEKNVLASHASPSVGELILRLGKESDNFTAEMLFLALGATKHEPARAEDGAAVVAEVIRTRAGEDPSTRVVNGSGLFDANRISASVLTKLLASAIRDPQVGPELLSHFAIGGVDGTLRGRFKKWAGARNIRAKTGTLADVVALSGFVLDSRGRPAVAFSFMTSGVKGKTGKARDALDRAVGTLASTVSPL